MRIRRITPGSVAVSLVLLVACDAVETRQQVEEPTHPPNCEAEFRAPATFEATETFKESYPDHVGVRLSFRDDQGRLLEFFAGIPGEFGEGLPVAGAVGLTSGEEVSVIGKGEIWVIAWNTPGPCGSHAVLGNGFTKRGFIEVLKESGVIGPG